MAGGAYRPGHDHDTRAELMVRYRNAARPPVRARKIRPYTGAPEPVEAGRARCACGSSVALNSSGQTMRAHRSPNGEPCPLRWTGSTVQLDKLPPVTVTTTPARRHGPPAPIPVELPELRSAASIYDRPADGLRVHATANGVESLCRAPIDTDSLGPVTGVTCKRCRDTRLFRAALRAAAQDA